MTKKLTALKLKRDDTTSFVYYSGDIIGSTFEYDQDVDLVRWAFSEELERKKKDGTLCYLQEWVEKLFSSYNIDVSTKSTSRIVIGLDNEYEELVHRYMDVLPGIRVSHRQGVSKNHQYCCMDIRAFVLTKVIVQVPNSALNYLKLKNYNVFDAVNYNLSQETIEEIIQEKTYGNC